MPAANCAKVGVENVVFLQNDFFRRKSVKIFPIWGDDALHYRKSWKRCPLKISIKLVGFRENGELLELSHLTSANYTCASKCYISLRIFLGLRKILIFEILSVTWFFSWRFLVRKFATSSKLKSFVRHLKNSIFFSKCSNAAWGTRGRTIRTIIVAMRTRKKIWKSACYAVILLGFSCAIFRKKIASFISKSSKAVWEYWRDHTEHHSSCKSAQIKKLKLFL